MGIAETREKYARFTQQVRSLMLSTLNEANFPHASYAPFVQEPNHDFYILVSGLSQHTQNLLAALKAAIMIIEDESHTEEIFARDRLMYDCAVKLISHDDEDRARLLNSFRDKFGELIDTLMQLSDFKLFQLRPVSGRFVVGFGAAYDIDIQNNHHLRLTRG